MSEPLADQLLIYGATNGAVVALNAAGFTVAYAVARHADAIEIGCSEHVHHIG